jgi:hypothetical protein
MYTASPLGEGREERREERELGGINVGGPTHPLIIQTF